VSSQVNPEDSFSVSGPKLVPRRNRRESPLLLRSGCVAFAPVACLTGPKTSARKTSLPDRRSCAAPFKRIPSSEPSAREETSPVGANRRAHPERVLRTVKSAKKAAQTSSRREEVFGLIREAGETGIITSELRNKISFGNSALAQCLEELLEADRIRLQCEGSNTKRYFVSENSFG
jgi:hypothetical protein